MMFLGVVFFIFILSEIIHLLKSVYLFHSKCGKLEAIISSNIYFGDSDCMYNRPSDTVLRVTKALNFFQSFSVFKFTNFLCISIQLLNLSSEFLFQNFTFAI